ncbi:MAG TPA: phage holin family protein [Streptosporangiaceae bacterium]|jgi:UDP-N-acetylglucosamine:LPS N-acetylglucosamine transferase|nr:phage holin family protein [Streptosporangiaceae bacterium]
MTETPETPQAGIAEAVSDLTQQTRNLVRREMEAAQREMWQKAKDSAPAFALVVAAGALGLLAVASSYRLSIRLLEKRLSPAAAAFTATIGYGAGAAGTAMLAARRIRDLPPLFPTETARQAGKALSDAAGDVSG